MQTKRTEYVLQSSSGELARSVYCHIPYDVGAEQQQEPVGILQHSGNVRSHKMDLIGAQEPHEHIYTKQTH